MSANNIFNEWKFRLLEAWAAGANLHAHLLMEESPAITANVGKDYVSSLGTTEQLRICDATGYPAAGIQLQSVSVTKNDTDGRGQLTCADISFSALQGNATYDYVGILIYDLVTNPADSPIVTYIYFTNGPLSKQATQIDVPITAAGLLHAS